MLYTGLEKVKANDREDLLNALKSLCYFDCDFNGENGLEYAWNVTIENGFESNMEYLLDKVKDIKDDVECVAAFINEWLENDSYFEEFEFNCLKDDNDNVIAISLAVVTE